MNNSIKFLVEKKNNAMRLDVFLSKKIKNYTRSYIKKLIEKKRVQINNNLITTVATKVKTKDRIFLDLLQVQNEKLRPNNIKLNI